MSVALYMGKTNMKRKINKTTPLPTKNTLKNGKKKKKNLQKSFKAKTTTTTTTTTTKNQVI